MISTLVIIAITCLISFIAFNNRKVIDELILWPPAVSRGQYYRLITYGFIHADMQHLLFNMMTLFFFGIVMERFYNSHMGELGFFVFYAAGLVISILPTYAQNKDNANYRSLGASGAVSAVLFAFILLQPWSIIFVFAIPVPAIVYAIIYIVYSVYMDKKSADNVNHSAHLWGAAYGVAFTGMIEPRVLRLFLDQLTHPQFRF